MASITTVTVANAEAGAEAAAGVTITEAMNVMPAFQGKRAGVVEISKISKRVRYTYD